ncbi:formyl transferase [Microdochium bolleyi]|uniref:methionyl-tRNA formyltransferase n=1 Tax=Microdochium bolleyi TaxID=196109 RepID=A0A136J1B4_9PEZI|nr:formyl transferase [Microdochium bolleyi]
MLLSARARCCTKAAIHKAIRFGLSSTHAALFKPTPGCWTRRDTHSSASSSTAKTKRSDPLHILFCGSDDFSCASLEAIHLEHRRNPDLISSIDVVVRPGKPTGRGLKIIRQPPLQGLASSLGLRIHERDTFTGWNMPQDINLVIAVSFGLFVPPRLLQAAKYGGLNVHPSLLPDLRGPAPLQHTLLQGRQFTGVTLQTLDHQTFDHGLILSQTPGDAMPLPADCTFQQLHDMVAPAGAELLAHGLREGLHVPPLQDVSSCAQAKAADSELHHAPKIRKEQRQITPSNLAIMARSQRAIGPVWFFARDPRGGGGGKGTASTKNDIKRVIVQDLDTEIPPALQGAPESVENQDYEAVTLTLAYEGTPSHADTSNTPREKRFEHLPLKAWVRRHHHHHGRENSETPGHQQDRDYIYLPDQGCRIKQVTVEGGKRLPARLALTGFLEGVGV